MLALSEFVSDHDLMHDFKRYICEFAFTNGFVVFGYLLHISHILDIGRSKYAWILNRFFL